ncbi:hypothetical protein CBL_03654 [Carabus blaptoides fortunei]
MTEQHNLFILYSYYLSRILVEKILIDLVILNEQYYLNKNIPTRISINEIKRTLVKDVPKSDIDNVAEKVTEHARTVRFNNPEIPEPAESDLSIALFEDLEDSVKASKKIKQYVRKRKRLPSVESHDSDNESDTELPAKKKSKETKRTKEEEEEIERLASFYNSMFEEIEQHPLCIE